MLWKEKNYTIGVDYIFNQYIREYDISKANINILYAKGVISKEYYWKLFNAERMDRQVSVGYLIKNNPNVQEILSNGIIEYKKLFFEANGLNDNDILSIKNDAIFILNKVPQVLRFDNVEFRHKNTYTSFMKLNELEVYYGSSFGQTSVIDVKGIKDQDLESYHMNFLEIIIGFLMCVEQTTPQQSLEYISHYIDKYIKRELPVEVYRRFRSSNDFIIPCHIDSYSIMFMDDTEYNRSVIDISHNFALLMKMHMYASQLLYEEKIRD